MKKTRVLALLLALAMLAGIFAACTDDSGTSGSSSAAGSTGAQSSSAESGSSESSPEDTGTDSDYSEPLSFTWYFNNDWETIHPWGQDKVSAFLKEKFNVDINFSRADADYNAKLNIMISSNELPDIIQMGRDANFLKMAGMGLLQSLDPLREENPEYDTYVRESTRDLLRVDGELYTIPTWARANSATGGNLSWMYNKKTYEAAGSPDLSTFEGLYEYAKKAKEIGETEDGLSIIPFSASTDTPNGESIINGFHRSLGAPSAIYSWYAPVDGKLTNVFYDDQYWRPAVMEANKWFREGLIAETSFSDTRDQLVEKQAAGRIALMYYDFSLDDVTHFRQILKEAHPDDDYVVLTDPAFPPAGGIDPEKVYGEFKLTSSGDGINITTKCENPQRIFDMCSYLMSPEGACLQMYGPQGDALWDETDENGNPILKKAEGTLTEDERNQMGLWFWMIPAHADSVDEMKFAVNAALPEEDRSFVVNYQANVFTPLNFLSDEFFGLRDTIDPTENLGIQRQTCEDQISAQLPKIIMASTEEEATKLYDELVDFLKQNGMDDVVAKYDEKYQQNVEIQGFTAYDR